MTVNERISSRRLNEMALGTSMQPTLEIDSSWWTSTKEIVPHGLMQDGVIRVDFLGQRNQFQVVKMKD